MSTVVLVVLVVLIVLVLLILLVLLVLVFVLLILILIVHRILPPAFNCVTASISCPEFQDLSFALKIMLVKSATVIAVVIPPAVARKPPVKIPMKPS